MAMNDVMVCKIFTFDSSHQLLNHKGKCANVHGHTYKLEVRLKGQTNKEPLSSDEGFVIDFADMKSVIKKELLTDLDHAFLAQGNEPIVKQLLDSGSKVYELGFRTTVENLAIYICWKLKELKLPVYSVRLWETPTGWAEVLAHEIPEDGPTFF
ncbi:6-pyruvoyl trahydropterin synthase family protein [Bacillus changyiensis]|uniref:6-pyruvoyl trahydropterin synthase family protein n=1 Tax=Bacillus changyiensis TaxID=3004103 RepID=UPI0022E83290|nr:6-carboxytetrahydropterin synthase [Bacillus changyiensis]MDA1477817.1 6-carboxytetrahydropterin synthase [Bacillus changyiensis]